MKTDLFQYCSHCWVFQICWRIDCSTFTALSFRIWYSSTGIPSPPLALFIVMLPKVPWLHTLGCLTLGEWSHHDGFLGHEDLFCTVLLCILATSSNIFCFSYVHTIPVLYCAHLCMKCSLVPLNFLKTSLVFPILLFSSLSTDHWGRLSYLSLLFFGTLHSEGYIFPFLLCFSLLFFSQLFVRPPQTTILPFLKIQNYNSLLILIHLCWRNISHSFRSTSIWHLLSLIPGSL